MSEILFKTTQEIAALPASDILTYLFNLAMPSQQTLDVLQKDGWETIYSFRPYKPNGEIDRENVESTLTAISRQVTLTDGYWKLCTTKQSAEQESNSFERDHVHYVMKKHEVEVPR